MKFAGDSMIVAFSPSRDERVDEDDGLKAATVRCLHCATHLVDKYGNGTLHLLHQSASLVFYVTRVLLWCASKSSAHSCFLPNSKAILAG